MNRKEYRNLCALTVEFYGGIKDSKWDFVEGHNDQYYNIATPIGNLNISIYENWVAMRFESEGFNEKTFIKLFGHYVIGRTLKWNIHMDDLEDVFNELEMRLSRIFGTLYVRNWEKFCLFNYENTEEITPLGYGCVVFKPSDNEIGVVIQLQSPSDYRTDMFGNCDLSEIRPATLAEVTKYRHELLEEKLY